MVSKFFGEINDNEELKKKKKEKEKKRENFRFSADFVKPECACACSLVSMVTRNYNFVKIKNGAGFVLQTVTVFELK